MHRLAVLATVCLLVTAGCVSSAGDPAADATENGPDATDPTTTPDPTTDSVGDVPTGERTFETTNCSDAIRWVSFYALNEAGRLGLWTPGQAAVGYTLKENASVFLAAYVEGERIGVEHVSTVGYDHGVTADGDAVAFDRALDDRRAIRIVAHRDADRNRQFDPETDRACTDGEGDLISTGVETVDFGSLETSTSPEPSETETET